MMDERPPEESRGAFLDWMIKTFDPWLESKKHSNLLIIGALILVSIPIIGVGVATTRTILPYDWKQIVPALPLTPPASSPFSTPITALFTCENGKTIAAVFFDSSVELTLSDGRHLTLPRARSADGARYANSDESFVFWNVGDTAFIQENGTEMYSGCVTKS
jgi:membrane-bound inhibitor of C-type lysozyme